MATSFIFDAYGKRKYLDKRERQNFLKSATRATPDVATFCTILAYSGARISEVLELSPSRIDFDMSVIVFECLKKRKRGHYRAVPLPRNVLETLDQIHDIRWAQNSLAQCDEPIWAWSRTTAWRRVKEVMEAANVSGPHASPKGLRHSMGVLALQSGVPLPTLQKWLGHTHLKTTAIYSDATGREERKIASNYWQSF